MKKNIILLICASIYLFSLSKNNNDGKLYIDIEVSKKIEKISKLGVPKISTIEEMKKSACALYKSESWDDAIIAYKNYIESADLLANLLFQCLKPHYSASGIDRRYHRSFYDKKLEPIDNKVMELREDINTALVRIGISYKRIGNIESAVIYLCKGLENLFLNQEKLWELANNELIHILGLPKIK